MSKIKNQYGQYMTQDLICDFMVGLISKTKDCTILEPSCGTGAFIKALHSHKFFHISAYEIDHKLIDKDLALVCDIHCESFVSAKLNVTFDVIIGNPPYIRWKNLEEQLKAELVQSKLWQNYCNSLCDYSSIFILKSIELLKEGGELIFITPEYWLSSTHALKLRNYMLEHGYFECIYYFNETPMFKDVAVSLVIFKYIKTKYQVQKAKSLDLIKCFTKKPLTKDDFIKLKNKDSSLVEYTNIDQFKANQAWVFADHKTQDLLKYYEQACRGTQDSYTKLGEYFDIGNGMVSGLDKAFQIPGHITLNDCEQQACIKVIKAKHLMGYYHSSSNNYIFTEAIGQRITESDFIKLYPNFYKLLIPHKDNLLKRYNYGKDIAYWEWSLLRNYKLFSKASAKIFVPSKERITHRQHFRFSYVDETYFATQDVSAIYKKDHTKEHLYYVLALLNSSYVFNWLMHKGIKKGDIIEFSEKPLASIPYRLIDFNKQTEVCLHDAIVEHMQSFLHAKNELNLNYINSLIDKLIALT